MKIICVVFLFLSVNALFAQSVKVDKKKVKEDLEYILKNISNNYVYLEDKEVDMNCIRERYSGRIDSLKDKFDVLLFFEHLLMEFYDNHISLNTNLVESYRLSSPIYVELENGKAIIKNVWQTQINNLEKNILEAEIVRFNDVNFQEKLDNFPSFCNDKMHPEVRNWMANKIISGKYNEPRVLTLKLRDGEQLKFDLDELQLKQETELLTTRIENGMGIIRINNSLGNNRLISAFDKALDSLFDTKGLILDLRNTNDGGNTYVAKGIMGRFIDEELPYQKHLYVESFDNQPAIVRSWYELVSPRGKQYKKPVIVLVGRWTGSMGEGMAVGFDAMNRGETLGTEMKKLAGAVSNYQFLYQNYGYQLGTERLYHIDWIPREEYKPRIHLSQSNVEKDEALYLAMLRIRQMLE